MLKKLKIFLISVAFSLISVINVFAQNEQITITTYYPSPVGVYNDLQANRLAVGDVNGINNLDAGDLPADAGNLSVAGKIQVGALGAADDPAVTTPVALCRNASGQIANCPALSGMQVSVRDCDIPGSNQSCTVSCNADEMIIGGGFGSYRPAGPPHPSTNFYDSIPSGNGWRCRASQGTDFTFNTRVVKCIALCLAR